MLDRVASSYATARHYAHRNHLVALAMFEWHNFARQRKAMRRNLKQAVQHYDGRKLQGQTFQIWKRWCNIEGRASVRFLNSSTYSCIESKRYSPASQPSITVQHHSPASQFGAGMCYAYFLETRCSVWHGATFGFSIHMSLTVDGWPQLPFDFLPSAVTDVAVLKTCLANITSRCSSCGNGVAHDATGVIYSTAKTL